MPHFDALTHMVIRVSSAFIFQTFAEVCYSVFVKRSPFKILLNLRKAYIFQEFAEGPLSICVCWIFQNVHLSNASAAVVPKSKSTAILHLMSRQVSSYSILKRDWLCTKLIIGKYEEGGEWVLHTVRRSEQIRIWLKGTSHLQTRTLDLLLAFVRQLSFLFRKKIYVS